MKTLSLILIGLSCTLSSFAQQGLLEVSIDKANTLDGKIYIAIYTEDNFLRQTVLSSDTELKENIATAVFENLEYGTYAIAAYQDVNGNENLDRGEYGRPTEPWVMSGSQASMMPIWMDSKIEFKNNMQSVKLKL